ncbi:hypothetical protein QQF64_021760, partial [Cirrhinus molitorella]
MRRYRLSDIDYKQLTQLIQLNESQPSVKLEVYESVQEVSRHQPHGKLAQESLMNHVIKALKKFPIERSQSEHHIIYKLLKGVHSLTSQLGSQELKQISTVTTVETWDRGQIVFGHNGFYLVLKGSVKPLNHETLKEDQTVSTISAGGSFGSCEAVNAVDGGAIIQCVMTLETCEILKISRSGYEKLKKDLLAQDHEVKVSLIQGCQLYLHWPKLSINHLVDGMQLKTFPANQALTVYPARLRVGLSYHSCSLSERRRDRPMERDVIREKDSDCVASSYAFYAYIAHCSAPWIAAQHVNTTN